MIFLWFLLVSADKPVLQLDDIYIEGSIRRPPITEIGGSRLQQKINEAAVMNLKKLEERLLKPLTADELRAGKTQR